jgi:hypothetical protein
MILPIHFVDFFWPVFRRSFDWPLLIFGREKKRKRESREINNSDAVNLTSLWN